MSPSGGQTQVNSATEISRSINSVSCNKMGQVFTTKGYSHD